MENLDLKFWKNKKVLVTGASGFKGSWLCSMLLQLEAKVIGYSLKPPTNPSIFNLINLSDDIHFIEADILDLSTLKYIIDIYKFDIVFHLAAQSLVIESYKNPIDTYMTNVIGTAKVLESVRNNPTIKSVVVATTDKCYDNKEWEWPYRESDPLGGHDPYSNSKACAEFVVDSYRRSFLSNIGVATARSGNVIGGGDFSQNRLIPDCIKAMNEKKILKIRNPNSIRPWQHVLEPLLGYILLAQNLYIDPKKFSQSWNFGPDHQEAMSVLEIANYLYDKIEFDSKESLHEARHLKLDSSKAKKFLNWNSKISIKDALDMTLEWNTKDNKKLITFEQIKKYLGV